LAFAETGGVQFAVAGITLGVYGRAPGFRLDLAPRLSRFVAHKTQPDVVLDAEWGDLSAPCAGTQTFRSGKVWNAYRHGDGALELRFWSPVLGPSAYKSAVLDPARSSGRIVMHREYFVDRVADPIEYPLDELLTWEMLSAGRGVAIHASSVVDAQGRGLLFVGRSGAGKTTMARLWHEAGAVVPSDERTILTMAPAGPLLHGTPWPGDGGFSEPVSAPLGAIFFIDHGADLELSPVRPADATARLVANSFVPYHSHHGLDASLGLLAQVVNAAPCRDLRFPLGPQVVPQLSRLLDCTK
jgi:hypothetical protein